MRYPKYMFLTYGWYDEKWWEEPNNNCSSDQLASVLPYTLSSLLRDFPVNESIITETGIVSLIFDNAKNKELVLKCSSSFIH